MASTQYCPAGQGAQVAQSTLYQPLLHDAHTVEGEGVGVPESDPVGVAEGVAVSVLVLEVVRERERVEVRDTVREREGVREGEGEQLAALAVAPAAHAVGQPQGLQEVEPGVSE